MQRQTISTLREIDAIKSVYTQHCLSNKLQAVTMYSPSEDSNSALSSVEEEPILGPLKLPDGSNITSLWDSLVCEFSDV